MTTPGLAYIPTIRIECGCRAPWCGCCASFERAGHGGGYMEERRRFDEELAAHLWRIANDGPHWLCPTCGEHEGIERREFELVLQRHPFEAGDTLVSYAQRVIDRDGEGWRVRDVRGSVDRLDATSVGDARPRQVFGVERVIVEAERERAA